MRAAVFATLRQARVPAAVALALAAAVLLGASPAAFADQGSPQPADGARAGAPIACGHSDGREVSYDGILLASTSSPEASSSTTSGSSGSGSGSGSELSLVDSVALGIVEGVTEYLPVSSTGHLLVTEQALGLTGSQKVKSAAESYAIVIQFGAILAVLVLYWRRFWEIIKGIVGRDPRGRHLAWVLLVSFVPAIIIGYLGEKYIKDYLFAIWPIIGAWIVGGIGILIVARHDVRHGIDSQAGVPLERLSARKSLLIGIAQCIAMWPGVSRSLVTILGGRAVGLSTAAAVEFSFLLGLVTLVAASGYETIKSGSEIVSTLGIVAPIVGIVVAFIAAVIAVRWMVGYLTHHSLAVFGWYRIVVGVVVAALVLTGVL